MNQSREREIIDAILARAAEEVGDLTPTVIARYYRQFPAARERFEAHASGDVPYLEGSMVEGVLFYLMNWVQEPAVTEIALSDTASHHLDTLGIDPVLFLGLLDVVHVVIAETIPASSQEERMVWNEVQQKLHTICATAWAISRSHPSFRPH